MILDSFNILVGYQVDDSKLRRIESRLNGVADRVNRRFGNLGSNVGTNDRNTGNTSKAKGKTVLGTASQVTRYGAIYGAIYKTQQAFMDTVNVAKDYEATMIDVGVSLGANGKYTEKEQEALQKQIRELAADSKYTMIEVAQAVEMLGRNGLSADKILDGALRQTINLGVVTRADLKKTADIITDVDLLYSKYGITLETATDRITAATLISKFGFDDMRMAIGNSMSSASDAGMSFDDLTVALSAIAPAFVSGRTAGKSFQYFLKQSSGLTKKARGAIEDLKLDLFYKKGPKKGMLRDLPSLNKELRRVFLKMDPKTRKQRITDIWGNTALKSVLRLIGLTSKELDGYYIKMKRISAEAIRREKLKGMQPAIDKAVVALQRLQIAIMDTGLLKWLEEGTRGFAELTNTLAVFIENWNKFGLLKGLGESLKRKERSLKSGNRGEYIVKYRTGSNEWFIKNLTNPLRKAMSMAPLKTKSTFVGPIRSKDYWKNQFIGPIKHRPREIKDNNKSNRAGFNMDDKYGFNININQTIGAGADREVMKKAATENVAAITKSLVQYGGAA